MRRKQKVNNKDVNDLRKWFQSDISPDVQFVKMKYFCSVKDGTHDTPKYVDPSSASFPLITSKDIVNGEIDYSNAKYISKDDYLKINRRSDVRKNDVIMPMIGTIGNPSIVSTDTEFSIKNVALFKTEMDVVKAKYLKYILESHVIMKQFELLNRGGVQSFVSLNVLENLYIIIREDIKMVVNFLDQKTSEIDSLIANKEKLIELLEEKRQAIITEAVTKGLNPDVKMKDSGVEWIGEIPEHWEVKKLKYVSEVTMGQSPPSNTISDVKNGIPFLQGNAEFTDKYPSEKLYCTKPNKMSYEKDILLSVRAPVGALNIANKKYGIGRGLCAIHPIINTSFVWYVLLAMRRQLKSLATGSTFEAVSISDVCNLEFYIPPSNEQEMTVEHLDSVNGMVDGLLKDTNIQIQRLKEYRQSLIYEAVTGKIDVRNYNQSSS